MTRTISRWLATATLLAVATPQAFAAGTTAGSQIGNTATVNYKIGTVDQTAQSDTANFKVDRLLSVTVAEVGSAATEVAPGANSQPLRFTVTNGTNDQMDIALSATNRATNDTLDYDGAGPGTALQDNFDTVGAFTYYIDVDGDGVFEPGADDGAAITFLDEVLPDAVTSVWVVSAATGPSIPLAQVDGDVAIVTLTATLHDSDASDGLYLVDSTGAEDLTELYEPANGTMGNPASTDDAGAADVAGTIQNVFADAAGTSATDGVEDGKHSADDAYRVGTATITVSKQSLVYWDPINELATPKAIPGAVVLYCITVKNEGGTAATDVTISDVIPENTTFVDVDATLGVTASDSLRFGTAETCTVADWTGGTPEDSDSSDGADADAQAGNYDPLHVDGPKVTTTKTTLSASGGVTTTMFLVKID